LNEQLISSRKSITNLLVPFPTILITQDQEGTYNPTTMSYVSAIHWDPPSIILSVGKNLKSGQNLEEYPNFTICILKNDPESIEFANKLGTSSGKHGNKLDSIDLLDNHINLSGEKWPPAIKGAVLALHGSIVKKMKYHDQLLYIAEIHASKMSESLQMLDEIDRNKLWGALEEIALTHSDIYEETV
jgi:flavin reductase (DIM6/NTAB) family NADH-FMN oxidoreductase RutF